MRQIRYAFVVGLAVLFACGDNKLATPDAPAGPACSDGIDNDGDGMTDFPEDLGCESADGDTESAAVKPQCMDNRDNDGDGKIDFPSDPGCPAGQADDELDTCPSGPGCPQCGDGMDNDGNGKADFPLDSGGCMSAADMIEFTDDPNACGAGMVIKMLPVTGMDTGALTGTTSNVSSPCGGGGGKPGVAYVFHLLSPKVIVATTDDPMTVIDTVLDLRSSMCSVPGAELACHDDILPSGTTPNKKSTITKSLPAGNYYLVVGGKTSADTGMYALKVEFFPGEGASCTMTSECGPGLECRVPTGQTQMVCTGPVCNDLRDDDGDGKIDFPLDPGCTSLDDDTENDVCNTTPSDPMCPQCANTVDDDMDGHTDWPADPSCMSASSSSESCTQSEAVTTLTSRVTMGTTTGKVNDFTPTCVTSTNAPDVAYRLDVPNMVSLTVALTGFDTVHAILDSTCQGTAIACSDPPSITRTNVAGGTYYVVVDGYGTNSGAFTLTTTGTVAAGGSCEGMLFQSGAFTCAAGYACSGTPGSRTCAPATCNDTIDNDGDGKADYPLDPGCASTSDNTEADDCYPTIGPACPVCSNGVDDDSDTLTDYPADTRCPSASFFVENFCAVEVAADIAGVVTTQTTTGTLMTAMDNYDQSCQSNTGNDVAYGLHLPVPVTSLTIDTIGSEAADTVVSMWNVSCGTQLGCDDDGDPASNRSLLTVSNVAAGDYAIQVDAYSTGNNLGFTLNVRGTVANGIACTDPLFAAGVLACESGTACTGGSCVGSFACNDGMDNDGDGKTNYPADPGCSGPLDNDETDDCYPTVGPNCPLCADGMDNDGDGMTDYSADSSCFSASEPSESCTKREPLIVATTPMVTGTTLGALDDVRPPPGQFNGHTCSTTLTATSPDVTVMLDVPALESLSLTLNPVGYDSAHVLFNSTCGGTPIECYDDPNGMNLAAVAAGRYYLVVDGYSTGSGTFTLNIRGSIVGGQSCESPLAQSGALVCAAGYTCGGTPGTRTCVPLACNDGIDNDGDGKMDAPQDPGCTSRNDNDESDDCYPTIGPACPACANGMDDDTDTFTDYPADVRCPNASFFVENFCSTEAVADIAGVITTPTTTGTLATAANNYNQSCQATTGNDIAYGLRLPVAVASLRIDTIGSVSADTVVSLWNVACSTSLGCDDDGDPAGNRSLLTVSNVAAGDYAIQVDAYSTGNNQGITLNVRGTVAAGTACTDPLFTSGVLVCPSGMSCTAGTCQ